MDPMTLALYFAGVIHFAILIASAMTPGALDWKHHLEALPLLLRQMFWVYGAFIVLMILGFGTLTMVFAPELARGTPLGRAVCATIAIFWGARLFVQLFVFDAGPWLTRRLYRVGYHALTPVFVYLTAIYTWAALFPVAP